MIKRNPLLGLALFFSFAFLLAAPQAKSQIIPSFSFENYTDCDIDIMIQINCPGGGGPSIYFGTVGFGGTFFPTPGFVPLVSGPGYDPTRNPKCTIDIMVRVNGQTYWTTNTTDNNFTLTYCCATPPPTGCTVGNNCTTLVWSPYTLGSYPGC